MIPGRVGLQRPCNPEPGTNHDDQRQDWLRELLEKGSDASFLREMIGFAAQRLMELEVGEVTGAGHGERSPERLEDPAALAGELHFHKPGIGGLYKAVQHSCSTQSDRGQSR